MNLAPGSFDSRRELGIETRDAAVVERLEEIARHDWKHSHALDLSDEGLLAELKGYDPNVKEDLAIGAGKHHKGK